MWSAGSRAEEYPQGSFPVQERKSMVDRGRQQGTGQHLMSQPTSPLFAAGGWYKGPRFSKLQEDQMIFTSSLAAFAHLWGMCPPRLSPSTWGSGTGLGGWLRSHNGLCSDWSSAQRKPHPPSRVSSVSRYTREESTKHPCWIWETCIGWELGG